MSIVDDVLAGRVWAMASYAGLQFDPGLLLHVCTHRKKKTARTAPPRTPEAVDGRRHIDIQTDTYLEELTDTIPENDNTTQTDPFLDRPPTPLFVPQKTGIDAVTQIVDGGCCCCVSGVRQVVQLRLLMKAPKKHCVDGVGDLFDFDFEVEPILEVLVGKVLEQGLMEVLEEEELEAMRAHQEHFEHIRNAELVATQRMEAAEKRKLEEKERRLAQVKARSLSTVCLPAMQLVQSVSRW